MRWRRKKGEFLRFEVYAKTVWEACILEFGWDKDVAIAAWRHMENPQEPFEFICDNPMSAMYRLKFYQGKFHLSYYGMNETHNEHRYLQAFLETLSY